MAWVGVDGCHRRTNKAGSLGGAAGHDRKGGQREDSGSKNVPTKRLFP